jgi:hypothetical protein
MTVSDARRQKSAATDTDRRIVPGRPSYFVAGVDSEGHHHVFRTFANEVLVVDPDRGRVEHHYDFDELSADHDLDAYMDFVDERRGWRDRSYGVGIGELIERALGAD